MECVLDTKELTKLYRKKAVVNHVDLHVDKGAIYGFIGKNGAGKTTFLRMISGLARPDHGTISLFGSHDIQKERRRVGTMIENPALYPNMTAKQNLELYCRMYGVTDTKIAEELLHTVGLGNVGNKKAKNFSLGMKQSLAIAICLIGDPELLLLDEPINGLDPAGIKQIRELLLYLNQKKNITILVSSHILGELSKIATCYGIINEGSLIDEFTSADLAERCKKVVQIQVDRPDVAADILTKHGIGQVSVFGDKVIIGEKIEEIASYNTLLFSEGIKISTAMLVGQDLEDYFMDLMNRSNRYQEVH